jgi:serine/threonine-protein kinase
MTAAELGACEWFVWDLRRSNLIERGQLDQYVNEFLKKEPRAEPAALAQFLIDRNILTSFQAERLLHGKSQGLVLGPYTLQDALGTGSMGTVYKAQSKNDNQSYAVKVLPRRSMWNVRIARRQVRAFEQINHPAVVPFVDVGTSGSTHYLAWPFAEGVVLEAVVLQRGKLPPEEAALYTLHVAEGLGVCHHKDIFHGLLKPSNIMIGHDGQARILDFGIGSLLANAEGESLVDTMSTANSVTSGLDFASPECILEPSNRTPAGDQYSLGCVLYFCLTGQYPFPTGTAVEKMMAHQTKQPTPIQELSPDVPRELIDVVDRLMQKSPEARFPQTNDVIDALRPLAAPPGLATRALARANRMKQDSVKVQLAASAKVEREPITELSAAVAVAGSKKVSARTYVPVEKPADRQPAAEPAATKPHAQWNPFLLDDPEPNWAERLGPIGVIIGAVLAAGGTWILSMYLFQ